MSKPKIRRKLKDRKDYNWDDFEAFCEVWEIGIEDDEWFPYWECWKMAHSHGFLKGKGLLK